MAFTTPEGSFEPIVMFFGIDKFTSDFPNNDKQVIKRLDKYRKSGSLY